MKKLLQILNILFFAITLYVNYASSVGLFNNTTQADISARYDTLFTPAGYGFSIWGLIYLLLFGFVIYQSRSLFVSVTDDTFIEKTGSWFVLSCMANSLWCYFFVCDHILLSTLVIFFILFCLLQIVLRNKIKSYKATITTIVFLWWPFIIYSGWLTLACIANVTILLTKIGWDGWGISPQWWTFILIGVATFINLIVTWRQHMSEFALVGAWGLVAIGIANTERYQSIKQMAFVCAGLLIVSSCLHLMKNKRVLFK